MPLNRNWIPSNTPLGQAGGYDMLLRATGGNEAGAALLAAIARKESEFGKTSGRFKNNAWGWGVHLGPDVNTAPDWETMAKRVWQGLSGNLYKGAGLTTGRQILPKYAPTSENNTGLYMNQVDQWMKEQGLDPNVNVFQGGGGGGLTMRPDGPAARASGQAAGNLSSAAKQNVLNALGPRPSIGANLVSALGSGGNQSQALLGAVTRYMQQKQQYGAAEQALGDAQTTSKATPGQKAPAASTQSQGPVGNPVGSPVAGQKAQHSTHATSGLDGYPAYDYMAPAGTKVGAPVSGTVIRLSGKDPKLGGSPGGPLGYSVYLKGDDGKTYFMTHIDKLGVKVGSKVGQGQQIAVVADGPKSWSTPHVHMGVRG